MTPDERWRRVQALTEQLEGLPAAERDAALISAADDEVVRRDVLVLLRALEREAEARAAAPRPSEPLAPASLGPYRITGLLGRGGTSTVYGAERDINGTTQRVALKVLHAYLLDAEQIGRFRREQELLARLDHPAVCRLLDAGLTPAQQPYLVIQLVEGEPIDVYANRRRLSVPERIRLVIDVLDALGAAHRSLIVHLDLKPGNLLVTPDGRVHLLDFGTAKLIDPRVDLTTTRHFTPLYAAPEQLRGEPVTTASDIYGLGLVLYELLAGTRPFAAGSIVAVAERAAGATTTAPLAARVTGEAARDRGLPVERLRAILGGDIDVIVAKALAWEPAQRYTTAAAFAADLERYLANRPILARRQTAGYRVRKFAARNARALAVTLVLLAALTGAAAYGWRENRRALSEGRRAETTAGFLQWLIASANPVYGGKRGMTVVELVERAEQRLARGDVADAQVAAALEGSVGAYLFQSGQEARAIPVLNRALERARTSGAAPAALNAATTLGTVHLSRGDCAASIQVSTEADALYRSEAARLPAAVKIGYLISRDQVRDACEDDHSGALTVEGIALLGSVPDEGSDAGMPNRLLKALALNGYVRLLARQGKTGEAAAAAEEGLRLATAEPDGRNVRVALLQSRAAAEYAAGDVAAAARSLDEAASLAESTAAPFEAIRLKVMAGQRLAEAGQTERAVLLAGQALAEAERHASDLTHTRWMILVDAALTYFRAGHCELTPPLLAEADRISGGNMPPRWKGNRLGVEAFCLSRTGRRADAQALAKAAIAAAGSAWAPTSTFRQSLEQVIKTGTF
ncbi:MAG: serine/threonine protein kinase [Bryobacterales bacterium]|nr:serine/threonine protein kinase [Bryobacterales bacterium]